MASPTDTSDKKVLTMAEVQTLAADKEKCIMVINNHVYDITKFIDEVCKSIATSFYNSLYVVASWW